MPYRFGVFTPDPDRFGISRTDQPVRVEPQALQLLLDPVENRARMVSRDEIAGAIWDGRAVSRLRWLAITARCSAFRIRDAIPNPCEIGARLKLRNVLYGVLDISGNQLAAALELAETAGGEVNGAERAANSPGAHFIIWMIAAAWHGVAGRAADAARWAGKVRARRPDANQQHFFSAIPMRGASALANFGAALATQRGGRSSAKQSAAPGQRSPAMAPTSSTRGGASARAQVWPIKADPVSFPSLLGGPFCQTHDPSCDVRRDWRS